MTDISEQLDLCHEKYLLDFPAAIRLFSDVGGPEFFELILKSNKTIIISNAFKRYSEIVYKHADPREQNITERIGMMLNSFEKDNRLIISDHSSTIDFFRSFSGDPSVCLILLEHSFSLERMRDEKKPITLSAMIVTDEDILFFDNIQTYLKNDTSYSLHPVSRSTDYLDADIHCNVGDKVYDAEGNAVLLTSKISTGAEGIVFRTEDPKWVAKIYHKGAITPLRWRKLIHMTQKEISAKGICWPAKLLYTFNKIPVGFLMQTGFGHTLGSVFDGPDAVMSVYPEWGRSDVVRVVRRVLEKIIYIHLHGVIIGDIQMKNMMIKDQDHVYLIDMDSVQIEDMPCPVGTEEYTSPELWDFSFSDVLRKPVHEDYSCAILVFCILFCGQHPYSQRFGKETLREEIIEKSFPYISDHCGESLIPIGGYDKIWDALTERLRSMFFEAFRNGARFETIEWYEAINEYAGELENKAFYDPEAYRLFPHTDLTHREEDSSKPKTYKKSLREAILQASSGLSENESGRSVSYPDHMMYNNQSKSSGNAVTLNHSSPDIAGKASTPCTPSSFAKREDIGVVLDKENPAPLKDKPKQRSGRVASFFAKLRYFFFEHRRVLLLAFLLVLCIVLMMVIAQIFK